MSNNEYYHITDNPLKLMYDQDSISYARAEVELRILRKRIDQITVVNFSDVAEYRADVEDTIERIAELENKLGYK